MARNPWSICRHGDKLMRFASKPQALMKEHWCLPAGNLENGPCSSDSEQVEVNLTGLQLQAYNSPIEPCEYCGLDEWPEDGPIYTLDRISACPTARWRRITSPYLRILLIWQQPWTGMENYQLTVLCHRVGVAHDLTVGIWVGPLHTDAPGEGPAGFYGVTCASPMCGACVSLLRVTEV